MTKSIQPSSNLHKRKCAVSHTVSQNATNLCGPANSKHARDMDGHPMAIDLMDGGNTEEDEAVAHIVKANPKQHAQLEHASAIPGKAKQQRDRGKHQQSDQSSFQLQPCCNDESLPDPHMLDDFNVDSGVENEDDWFNDQHVVKGSRKNLSKISEVMALERPTWSSAAPSLIPSVAGSSSLTESIMSLPLMQGTVGASLILGVGGSTPLTPSVSGLTSTQSFGASSQTSSADVPCAT